MSNVLFHTSGSQKVVGMWPSLHALADEGALYILSTVNEQATKTAGTAIATTTSVVDDAATGATTAQLRPVLYLANTAPVTDSDAKSIYPLWMKFTVGAQAPTSATHWSYAMRGDFSPRYTSGGTRLNPVNVNLGSAQGSQALAYFGAVVTTAPSGSQRVLGAGQVQSTIPVVKDEWLFTFGDITAPTNILTASAAKKLTIPCGPIILAPGTNMTLEMWGTSNAAAPTFEFEMGYAERVTGL